MAGAGGDGQQTYWCHECDMSVSLQVPCPSPETTTLLCPHCFSDLLELMDSSPDSYYPDLLLLQPQQPPNDNYLLDSPFFQRLMHHFYTHPDVNPEELLSPSAATTTTTDSDTPPSSLAPSKASVEAIPTVQITASMLDLDPLLLCAVCKDPFLLSVDAKQLPCNHLYHPHCILPWLSSHSSCPLCRFQLPTDTQHQQQQHQYHLDHIPDDRHYHLPHLIAAAAAAAATGRPMTMLPPNLNDNVDSSFNGNL